MRRSRDSRRFLRAAGYNERAWILAATILGSSMAFIDGTVVNVALPALQSALRATLANANTIFSQQWTWNDTTVDKIQLFIETSGATFTTPGVTGLAANWSATDVNSRYVLLTGPAAVTFNYTTNFSIDGLPLVYNWYGSIDGALIDIGQATWDGANWSYVSTLPEGSLAAENTASPEPASFLLLGSGLLLAGIYRKRMRTAA